MPRVAKGYACGRPNDKPLYTRLSRELPTTSSGREVSLFPLDLHIASKKLDIQIRIFEIEKKTAG